MDLKRLQWTVKTLILEQGSVPLALVRCFAFTFCFARQYTHFHSLCSIHASLSTDIIDITYYAPHSIHNSDSQHTFEGTRKSQTTKAAATMVKYCSERCRHNKPSQAPGSIDRRIWDAFTSLLDGKDPSSDLSQDPSASAEISQPKGIKEASKKVKGETRITVSCAEVETFIFGHRQDPEKVFGRKKNRARRGVPDAKEWKSVDMEDKDDIPEGKSTIPI